MNSQVLSPLFDPSGVWLYGGTRSEWKRAKQQYPSIAFSPEKMQRPVSNRHISAPKAFRVDPSRQGFSRSSYRVLQHGITPLIEYYKQCMQASILPDLKRSQEIFYDNCTHSYDFYHEIDGHHFYVNSSELDIKSSIDALRQKRNPLFRSEYGESSEYHHLFMGHLLALGKEVIILIPSDLHRDHHELLHQFLAPGQRSLVRPDGDGLLFSQARQQANQLLLEYLLSKLSE